MEGNETPVFTQKSLTDLYKERIIYHGMWVESVDAEAFSEVAHCTHLRNAIMDKVPSLCVAKSGRTVSLTLDDEVGRALFEACAWSEEEDNKVLQKASRLIQK